MVENRVMMYGRLSKLYGKVDLMLAQVCQKFVVAVFCISKKTLTHLPFIIRSRKNWQLRKPKQSDTRVLVAFSPYPWENLSNRFHCIAQVAAQRTEATEEENTASTSQPLLVYQDGEFVIYSARRHQRQCNEDKISFSGVRRHTHICLSTLSISAFSKTYSAAFSLQRVHAEGRFCRTCVNWY